MTDEEYWELTYGELFGWTEQDIDGAGDAAADDHRRHDQPAHVALLHRSFPTYTEAMWIRGFVGGRVITVTVPPVRLASHEMPGVIQPIRMGRRDMASAEKFRSRFERTVDLYVEQGWVRKPVEVRTDGMVEQ
jgi:hypothetical protein